MVVPSPTLTSPQSLYTVNLLHGASNYARERNWGLLLLCGGVPRVNYDLQATVCYISVLYFPWPVFMNFSMHTRHHLLAQVDQHPRPDTNRYLQSSLPALVSKVTNKISCLYLIIRRCYGNYYFLINK